MTISLQPSEESHDYHDNLTTIATKISPSGFAKVRLVRATAWPVLDSDFPFWRFLDCGTVGAGGLPSDGHMMRVMQS
jgi:hypothetical protein